MANKITHRLYPGGHPGDNTTNSANCAEETIYSSTAAGSNKPKLALRRLTFSASTDQHRYFQMLLPANFVGTAKIFIVWSSTDTNTGHKVVWKAGIGETSGSNLDDGYLAADTNGTGDACLGTSDQEQVSTITLTITSIAANDRVHIFVGRDADDATNDTCTSLAYVTAINLEFQDA